MNDYIRLIPNPRDVDVSELGSSKTQIDYPVSCRARSDATTKTTPPRLLAREEVITESPEPDHRIGLPFRATIAFLATSSSNMLREPRSLEHPHPHQPAPDTNTTQVLVVADQCDTAAHTHAHTHAHTQSTTLFGLPAELTSQITSQLEYHDAVSFRLTCRSARELIPFEKGLCVKRATLKASLLAAERADEERRGEIWQNAHTWAALFPASAGPGGPPNEGMTNLHNNRITRAERLNCYACLRTLPCSEFHAGQMKGLRSLGHKEHAKRFCIDCGWGKGIWARGSAAGRGAQCVVICRLCGGLNRRADPLFRRERVCSMACWPQGLAVPGGGNVAGLDPRVGVEDDQQQQDGRAPVSLPRGLLSRRAKLNSA
ncbi:hypothetical protein G647_05194 [Cladophialophora carrionii CBS 160.54]|uniref:F-box domain-containing protein n=1 Tax=Cladophialophora carrionii CBS 160.54 TaxID=1279043 RepID=V9DAS5_9EURO|nr:uncharacterized protein G647_05194 [Cladophialophora carrionii CBS 160.54]ETI23393.1 hypothetical protein G647_05194 [Cladophialophora carrionii CBS 160.54]